MTNEGMQMLIDGFETNIIDVFQKTTALENLKNDFTFRVNIALG